MTVRGVEARILTGVPPYDQHQRVRVDGAPVMLGSGPAAALMLLAWWQARFGYRQLLARGHEGESGAPEDAAAELRESMHTLGDLFHGQAWSMTLPMFFQAGLEAYLAGRYGRAVVKEYNPNVFGRGVLAVYEQSRALIDAGQPHVLLMDWHGTAGVFPHHYVVVVGWRRDGGRRQLIVNAGWGSGSQFLCVDMADRRVRPATLFYIESLGRGPETAGLGPCVGPAPGYRWQHEGDGRRLVPVVRRHFSDHTEAWEPSLPARELVAGTEFTVCDWGARPLS